MFLLGDHVHHHPVKSLQARIETQLDRVRCVLLGNTPARINRAVVRVAHQVGGQR